MKRWFAFALVLLASFATHADDGLGDTIMVYGQPDQSTPGWAIITGIPQGWRADCCTYAQAIGVNLLLYRGDWTGEPDRVIVLNVWPGRLPSLEAELKADRKRYLARDPAAKAGSFPVRHRTMQCTATIYQGTDHVDDAVVFCDPGKATGIRLSWSMSFADSDPTRQALLDNFMRVVVAARYMHYKRGAAPAPPSSAARSPVAKR